MRKRDGWRHGWLGDTGQGKTWASRRLVEVPGQLTLIHDDSKAEPEYSEHAKYYPTPAALEAQPFDEVKDLTAVAFRGDPYAGVRCEVDDVAALALRFARARFPVRIVVDETDRAMSDAGRKLESPNLRECFTTGRSMGLSVIWSTQTPQRAPDVALNSSSSIAIFRLGPAALNYLDERLYFDREMLELVPDLAVGEFVLHRPGQRWDRTVYKF